jgi:hypothetical protein
LLGNSELVGFYCFICCLDLNELQELSLCEVDSSIELHLGKKLIILSVCRYIVSKWVRQTVAIAVARLAFIVAVCIVVSWAVYHAHVIIPKFTKACSAVSTDILASQTIFAALLAGNQIGE